MLSLMPLVCGNNYQAKTVITTLIGKKGSPVTMSDEAFLYLLLLENGKERTLQKTKGNKGSLTTPTQQDEQEQIPFKTKKPKNVDNKQWMDCYKTLFLHVKQQRENDFDSDTWDQAIIDESQQFQIEDQGTKTLIENITAIKHDKIPPKIDLCWYSMDDDPNSIWNSSSNIEQV